MRTEQREPTPSVVVEYYLDGPLKRARIDVEGAPEVVTVSAPGAAELFRLVLEALGDPG